MKRIYQGRTVWVVSGHGKHATIKQVYVAKSFFRPTEETDLVSEFIGVEKVAVTKEDIGNAEGLNKMMLMCGGPVRHLHTYSQSLQKVSVLHSFIEDRSGEQYDVTKPIACEIFSSRAKAKGKFAKRAKSFILLDEMHAFSIPR